jgi:hypothetical protein
VHDFAATPAEVPSDTAIAGQYERRDTPQTKAEIELGRWLGERVAVALVEDIRAMRLPAERAGSGPPAQPGDYVIKGALVSIDQGSQMKRMLIGFGAGAADLKTLVEAYQSRPPACARSGRVTSRRPAAGRRGSWCRSRAAPPPGPPRSAPP